ncbi:MAG TPA: hypothetical protein GXZ70_02845 [Clostridiales bacterium]|nr:hypothetical protein [Clostridiales bacterium]
MSDYSLPRIKESELPEATSIDKVRVLDNAGKSVWKKKEDIPITQAQVTDLTDDFALKADHGYGEGETVKTLKDVEDELALKADQTELDQLAGEVSLYNPTLSAPLEAGQYYTKTTARLAAISNNKAAFGLILTYQTGVDKWVTEQFIGDVIDNYWWSNDGKWVRIQDENNLYATAAILSDDLNSILNTNLINLDLVIKNKYYSAGSNKILSSTNSTYDLALIKVKPGVSYGSLSVISGCYLDNSLNVISAIVLTNNLFTAPAGAKFAAINLQKNNEVYQYSYTITEGSVPGAAIPRGGGVLKPSVIADIVQELNNTANKIISGKNMIDTGVAYMESGLRQNGFGTLVSNSNAAICSTKAILLKANTTYAISGSALAWETAPRAALYKNVLDVASGSVVVFTAVPGGFTFTTGATNLYFRVDLKTTLPGGDIVSGIIQLEEGSTVTEYEKRYYEFTSKNDKSVNGIYNIPVQNQNAHKKFPQLFNHYLKRDKNIQIILVGDSITARDYHTTYFTEEEKTKRPPLMVSKNLGSAIYDKLTWQNAEYARWDRTGIFTESGGTFATVDSYATIGGGSSNGITAGDGQLGDQWYDIDNRPSDTRIYTGSAQASVQFTIPENTYVFNWIYRTDLKGCIANTVSIAEGNGKVQVYNVATQTWVEANGYVFSMRHPGLQTHRINSKFQERLRFRCSDKYKGGTFDGRTGSKTITITKDTSDSRFLYWGIEWSKEPYIVTVINAARGGENISSMLPAMDDDVFDWVNNSPDTFTFVIHEIYLNQGQNNANSAKSINDFLTEWSDYFYSDANPYSYREQSKVGGIAWKKFEALTWNPNPTAGGGGILITEPYGWHVWESAADGMKTILDNFLCYLYQYRDNYDEEGHSMVNITMALLNEAKMKYGKEWYKAFQSSGVTGGSFYNDVTHPNDYGVNVISRWINSNFDFLLI